ncbi:MAG: hypothetical protein QGD92_03305, partial [Gammaproteobacteria bacterium]|nr:hypothetical protein [Gammaproteobacteria bacterium]
IFIPQPRYVLILTHQLINTTDTRKTAVRDTKNIPGIFAGNPGQFYAGTLPPIQLIYLYRFL